MAIYRDSSKPTSERVEDLLSQMTVQEKVGQITQYFHLGMGKNLAKDLDVSALSPELRAYAEQPAMVEMAVASGAAGSVLFVKDAVSANRIQRLAVDQTRLGIPLLFGFDVIHGLKTIFPVPIAMAASWNPKLAEESQKVAATESKAAGIRWTFAPNVDVCRDPRWGRIVEGAGEDPYLGSVFAEAQVRGFQGEGATMEIMAGPKHFAGYGASVGGRDYDDVELSDSELRNVYLPPFIAAVKAGAGNVMSAYMDFNGVPASGNRRLLTGILRDEIGFDGFVVSDANAVRSMVTQHHAENLEDAASRALNAGLDMEMCTFEPAFSNLPKALESGDVSLSELDRAVRRVLKAKFELGLFEHPYADEAQEQSVLNSVSHRELSQLAAEESFVLLKNEGSLLPINGKRVGRVAVVGQLADSKRDTLGPWVFGHQTDETVTILEGLRSHLPGAEIVYVPGASIHERIYQSPFDRADRTIENTPEEYDDDEAIRFALEAVAGSDLAVVVAGQRQNQAGERASTSTLDFPGRQLEQIKKIAATGVPVVLLVMSGRPLDLREAMETVPAIVQVWYPGTRGGDAVARMLLGEISPSGHLPFSWPRHAGQIPTYYAQNLTFEPENKGQRYWNEPSTPLLPFGFGLSYSIFEFSQIKVSHDKIRVGESAEVSVLVSNKGSVDAATVVQIYTHQRFGSSTRPARELKGFKKVHLQAGESMVVSFEVGPSQLSYWSSSKECVVQEAAMFDMWIGADSEAKLHCALQVTN